MGLSIISLLISLVMLGGDVKGDVLALRTADSSFKETLCIDGNAEFCRPLLVAKSVKVFDQPHDVVALIVGQVLVGFRGILEHALSRSQRNVPRIVPFRGFNYEVPRQRPGHFSDECSISDPIGGRLAPIFCLVTYGDDAWLPDHDRDMDCLSKNVSPQLGLSSALHCSERIAGNFSLKFRGIRRFLGGVGGNLGVVQAFADEPKLPEEQPELGNTHANQPESEKSNRVPRYPLPEGFLWLVCGAAALGLLIGGGGGWFVYRFGGRPDKAASKGEPHNRGEQRPE